MSVRVAEGPAFRVALVVEAPADADTVGVLVDRIVSACDEAYDDIDVHRTWIGPEQSEAGRSFFKVQLIKTYARDRRIRLVGGQFGGGRPYEAAAKKAVAVALHDDGEAVPNAVVLVVDEDAQADRALGLAAADEAHDASRLGAHLVAGVARGCREAWVLNAFEPRDEGERTAFDAVNSRVSFNVTREPERLNGPAGDPRDPKRVVAELMAPERQAHAVASCPLDMLRDRGEGSGLRAFLGSAQRLCSLWRNEPG